MNTTSSLPFNQAFVLTILLNAVAAVFIDFSKAFDSISHPLLVKKLQSIGVADIALTWFHDFLTNRQQRVVIDGHASSWLTIQKGVPQGALLGPLLFSIYTNDMPLTVKNCSINMYADDTALYTANTNAIKAADSVSKDLTAIHKWCLDNSITINFKKTYAMFLSRNLRSLTSQCNNAMIYLNGLPLQTVTEIHYLGVIIDSKLSFKSHISSIISKAYGALKTLTRTQASLPLSIRKRLYKALVLPILEYCPSVWDPSTSALSDRIEKVQNKAMRIILNKPLGMSSHPLRLELQWHFMTGNCIEEHYPPSNQSINIHHHTFITFLPTTSTLEAETMINYMLSDLLQTGIKIHLRIDPLNYRTH